MAPVFDASAYYTRRQSDARYVPLPAPPAAPTAASFTSTAVVQTATELFATATFSVTPADANGIVAYLFMFTDPNSNITFQQIPVITSPTTAQNLLINTVYTWQVASIDFYGQAGAFTGSQTFTTSNAVPALGIPQLTVTVVALGAQITLSPINTELAFSFYQLNRSLAPNMSSSTNVIEFTTATVIDKNIPATDPYFYQVQVWDDFGNSYFTNIVGPIALTETVLVATPAQPNVSGGSFTRNADGSITINWPGNIELTLTNYRIWRRLHGAPSFQDYDWIGATPSVTGTYTDFNTISGITYDYSVSAINSINEESTFDSVGYFTVASLDSQTPVTPTSMVFSSLGNGQGFVTASWTPSTTPDIVYNEISWRLRSIDAFYPGIRLAGNSFTIYGLSETQVSLGGALEIRVRASDKNGNFSGFLDHVVTFSELSNYSPSAGLNPPNPLEVTAVGNTDGSVSLSWTAPSGSYSKFRLMRFDSISSEWTWVTDVPISTVSYQDFYLEPFSYLSRTYSYSIQTIGTDGAESAWNQVYNSGFEFDGSSPVGWTLAAGGGAVDTIVTSPVDFGIRALKANNAGNPSQNLPVIVGKTYYFSADVHEDISAATAEIFVTWYNGGMGIISTLSNSISVNSSWQTVSITGTAPAGAVMAGLQLLGDTGSPTTTMIWDDARFELIDTGDTVSNVYGDNKSISLSLVDVIAPVQISAQLHYIATGVIGGIHLNWTIGTTPRFLGALYQIYQSTTISGTYTLIATVPVWVEGGAGFFAVTNINALVSTTFYYNIKVQDIYGNTTGNINASPVTATSQNLNSAQGYGAGSTPPTPVVLDTLSAVTGGGFEFTFAFAGGPYLNVISHYNVYRYTANTPSSASIIRAIPQGTGQCVVQDQVGSFSSTTLYYWVSAVDIYNNEGALAPAQSGAISTATPLDSVPDGSSFGKTLLTGLVNGIPYTYQGQWNSTVSYVVGEEVTYLGSTWLALINNLNSAPSTTNANWQLRGTAALLLGAYSGGTAYVPGNQVTYLGNLYVAIADTTGNLPTDPSFWELVGPQTMDALIDGVSYARTKSTALTAGIPFTFQGAWNSGTAYLIGQEVSYLGNYWVAVLDNTASTPTLSNTNWQAVGTNTLYYQNIKANLIAKPQEAFLNFISPITATDDPTNSSTDVAVSVFGASGGSHATGLVTDPGSTLGTTRFLCEDTSFKVPPGGLGGFINKTLGSSVPIASNTDTVIDSITTTMPSVGGPWYIRASYFYPRRNGANFLNWAQDGAGNKWAGGQGAPVSNNNAAAFSSGVSPVTYANGASVTVSIHFIDANSSTIETNTSSEGGVPATSVSMTAYMQIEIIAS